MQRGKHVKTSHEDTQTLRCRLCGDAYMRVGGTDVRLAKPRRVLLNPKTAQELEGVCPKHGG